MTAVVDLIWTPNQPEDFVAGDELDVVWANAGVKTYGLVMVYNPT